MPPLPALSFTIPSIHDDTTLDCRVYHPACLGPTSISQVAPWNKKAAIVAHPYAPLGGSMDDPVVGIITSVLLKQGFVVGTFNFRGAADSKGKTSWQAKAEQKDYISMIGFMIFYMHLLSPICDKTTFTWPVFEPDTLRSIPSQVVFDPFGTVAESKPSTSSTSLVDPPQNKITANTSPRLLLAGYSYGALITSLLPPIISSFVSPFQTPSPGSSYAEIRLRAESLASQQISLVNAHISMLLETHDHRGARSLNAEDSFRSPKGRKSSGVRMGGGEDLRRASHDSFRSRSIDAPEMVRKSVDRVRSLGKHRRVSPIRRNTHDSIASLSRTSRPSSGTSLQTSLPDSVEKPPPTPLPVKAIPDVLSDLQTAYLLVSPLQGLANSLATMWTSKCMDGSHSILENEMKFTIEPTLALFGDDDLFVSVKRLRSWAEKVSHVARDRGDGQFRYKEIEGAGHFWHSGEAVKVMQDEIRGFVRGL